MKNEPIRVSLVHLGCARNQVDSEVMLGRLAEDGVMICGDLRDAEVAVVNTCSFIGPAREESFSAIQGVLDRKKTGQLRAVLVAGCLAEQFKDEIDRRTPGVDAILPLSDYSNIGEVVRRAIAGQNARACPGGRPKQPGSDATRFLTTPQSYAYLRISEGCDHTCTFCIIPAIRGAMRSKPIETLVGEATNLAKLGVKELVLVAEDSTWYGRDLYGEARLPELIEALEKVEGIAWIRVMYAYPNSFPWRLTQVMAGSKKLVPYLDIPIQHIADPMLRAMRRAGSGDQVREIVGRLRREVPGIALRTTVIVGFPGETEQDFRTLLDFLGEFPFDRLGAFPFSDEPKADTFSLPGKVPPEIAVQRHAQIMEQQQRIVAARNRALVGKKLAVLIDGSDGRTGSIGRTKQDAPEMDCSVRIPSRRYASGELLQLRVARVDENGYDLIAS